MVVRALAVALVVVAVGGVGVLTFEFFRHRARVEEDSLVVYCLDPAQHGDLINAAEALRLATRAGGNQVVAAGETITPADWHDRHSRDFTRACEALAAAKRAPGPGLLATVLPFLTGLTAALVAFFAATWRDRLARGQVLADDLRDRYADFHRAVETFLSTPVSSRQAEPVRESRAVVLTQLARARDLHPGWGAVGRMRRELTDGDLGPPITVRWRDEDEDEDRGPRVAKALTRTQDTVHRVADALQRPLRSSWRMLKDRGGSS